MNFSSLATFLDFGVFQVYLNGRNSVISTILITMQYLPPSPPSLHICRNLLKMAFFSFRGSHIPLNQISCLSHHNQ